MDEVVPTGEVTSEGDPPIEATAPPESQPTDDQPTAESNLDSSTGEGDTPQATPVSFDADLDEWAAKTNRPVPTTDTERAAYQEIRNAQREYSRSQEAKKSEKDVSDAFRQAAQNLPQEQFTDPLEEKVFQLEKQYRDERDSRLRSEYFTANQVTDEESKAIVDILREKVERATAVSQERGKSTLDYWKDPDNLPDLHALARARLLEATDTSVIERQAAVKERERIAKEQLAAGTPRGATKTVVAEKSADDERLERLKNWD